MVCDLEFDSCPPWRPKDVFRSKSGENAPETPEVESDYVQPVSTEHYYWKRITLPEDVAQKIREDIEKAVPVTVPFRTDLNTILNLHDDLTSEAHNLVARKGRDYNRTEQEGGDTLANLKVAAKLGLVETPAHGVLVRLMDKIMRLKSLCKPGEKPANADEKVKDTVVDVINYAIYVYALHLEAGGE